MLWAQKEGGTKGCRTSRQGIKEDELTQKQITQKKNIQPEGNLLTPDAITMHNPTFHEHPRHTALAVCYFPACAFECARHVLNA
jgi:hypothetical protein